MAGSSKPNLIAVRQLQLPNSSPGNVLPIYRYQTQAKANPTQ